MRRIVLATATLALLAPGIARAQEPPPAPVTATPLLPPSIQYPAPNGSGSGTAQGQPGLMQPGVTLQPGVTPSGQTPQPGQPVPPSAAAPGGYPVGQAPGGYTPGQPQAAGPYPGTYSGTQASQAGTYPGVQNPQAGTYPGAQAPGTQPGFGSGPLPSGQPGAPLTAPAQVPPGQIAPGQIVPGQPVAGQPGTGQTAPGQGTPGQGTPGQGTPGQPNAQAQPPQPAPPLPNIWLPQSGAILQALDKINAQTTLLKVKDGQTVTFGSLSITIKACLIRPPTQPQDATAYIIIVDKDPNEPGFHGWMLKNEPSLSMFEHPLYDIQVQGCIP